MIEGRRLLNWRYAVVGLILVLGMAYLVVSRPPSDFPSGSVITVSEGSGLVELAEDLKDEHVIRSTFWFRMAAIIMGGERSMKAGQYYMEKPENPFIIAWRVVVGDHNLESVRVTIPEGFNVKKISRLFDEERFPYFDNEYFELTAPEGYLFPDTYFFEITATATSTTRLLREHFIKKIFPLMPEVEESGHTLEEIITMASILEGEAKGKEDKEIVAGILWKRIKIGMPLQVDTTFSYINGKTTAELTLEDLKINSPYNTYVRTGLPPTPVSNPGLESIEAALRPAETPYLYFLTANDGTMHYSKTFEEHVQKKQKYLR